MPHMKGEVQLTPLRISNGALQVKGFPRRLKLLNWGVNQTVYGPVIVNETTAALLPMNQRKAGFDTVALDYEHNTVPGTPEFERTKEPREIAANGVPLVVPGEGLFLDGLEYTPSGKDHHLNYIDLSPTPKLSKAGEVVFLHSVALCRHGAVEDLHYFTVPLSVEDGVSTNPNKENRMNELMSFLKKVFRLPDTATEDDVLKAFQAEVAMAGADGKTVPMSVHVKALQEALKPLVALVAEDGKLTTLSSDLTGLKSRIGDVDVSGKIATFASDLDGVRKDLACYQARLEGKVIPLSAEEIKTTPLATLQGIIAKTEPTVPVGQLTPLNVKPPDVSGTGLTDQDRKIAASLGFTDDEVAKANGLKS